MTRSLQIFGDFVNPLVDCCIFQLDYSMGLCRFLETNTTD